MAYQPEPEDGSEPDVEAMAAARRFWHKKALDAAFAGDPLAGSLMALEQVAEPYFLGLDYDPDDSDLQDLED